jgi:hypothetical protein
VPTARKPNCDWGSATHLTSMNAEAVSVRQFLTTVTFRYLSARADDHPNGNTRPHPPTKCELSRSSHSKVINRGHISVPFGPTLHSTVFHPPPNINYVLTSIQQLSTTSHAVVLQVSIICRSMNDYSSSIVSSLRDFWGLPFTSPIVGKSSNTISELVD